MTTNTQNVVHPVHIYCVDLEELAGEHRQWGGYPFYDLAQDGIWPHPWPVRATMLTDADSQARELCRKEDHEWLDESYGGPDSGCIHMTCKRCGYSIHHTLY